MEQSNFSQSPWDLPRPRRSNRILIKGLITGALILIMMIPTLFISNLVGERESRQAEIVKEVSSRWAGSQTLSGPYIYLPYTLTRESAGKKISQENHYLLLLPENQQLTGRIDHELRQRSIYKVLLYRASLSGEGNFIPLLPREIQPGFIRWEEARICFGLSDIKGMEDRLVVNFNGSNYELSPGLPYSSEAGNGLSAPVIFTADDIGKNLRFHLNVKIKGSEQLHFIPFGGNSHFALTSRWPNPSFDGYNLPTERTVTDSGFSAKWDFNKVSLPFTTALIDGKPETAALAFGMTMIQPADGYAKASRCVKYAILFIGLTFALFFIAELLQQRPVHPVQYILVGLALVIFYSLLLAFSEFIPFDLSYAGSSLATIGLISLYARNHFRSWRSAGLFGGLLFLLYGFIFVLIRLEDTALLIGSIGLFIILSLVMYASRNIEWYGPGILTKPEFPDHPGAPLQP